MDKIHDLREKERILAADLFEQFVQVGGCESLIRDLEGVAEEFLSVLYPNDDLKVTGKPKFTFSLENVKIDGSYQYNRETCGVNKNLFNKVSIHYNWPQINKQINKQISGYMLLLRRCPVQSC